MSGETEENYKKSQSEWMVFWLRFELDPSCMQGRYVSALTIVLLEWVERFKGVQMCAFDDVYEGIHQL
jgi:hypothetical protein